MSTATASKSKKQAPDTTPDRHGRAEIEAWQKIKPSAHPTAQVSVADIVVPLGNARNREREGYAEGIFELAGTMTEGLWQPIGVWMRPDGKPVLAWGHRRHEAAKLLKWEKITAVVISEEEARDARAIENAQRAELDPIEESIAVADLMDDAAKRIRLRDGFTDNQVLHASTEDAIRKETIGIVSKRLGKSVQWVRDRHFLGTLDKVTRELVIGGKLPMEHARELAKIADSDKRAELARRAAIDGKLHPHSYRKNEQPMLLRELRDQVATHIRSLAQVAWPLDIPFAEAPACEQCPSNSRNQTGLFEDGKVQVGDATTKEPEAGVCLNAACYGRKSGIASRETTTGAKRITATVNGLPVKERDAKAVAAAIQKHQPAHVKPAAFKKAVLDHRERFAGAAKNKGKGGEAGGVGTAGKPSKPSKPAKRAETAESSAANKLTVALSTWHHETARLFTPELAKKPLTFLLLDYVTRTKLSQQAGGSYASKGDPKAIAKLKTLIEIAVAAETIDAVKRVLAEPLAPHDYSLDSYTIIKADLIAHLAGLLGVKTKKPKPVLADFLPKAKAEPEQKAAAKGKKGKAPKPAKPAADLADDADLEGGEDE
ncbi:MAG TPA: ParB N-terminal domain-containing protein [Pseudomonadota bacterium]|nr:ParB N-terminal domain-containing protein [Pseudomonadota bacterium]